MTNSSRQMRPIVRCSRSRDGLGIWCLRASPETCAALRTSGTRSAAGSARTRSPRAPMPGSPRARTRRTAWMPPTPDRRRSHAVPEPRPRPTAACPTSVKPADPAARQPRYARNDPGLSRAHASSITSDVGSGYPHACAVVSSNSATSARVDTSTTSMPGSTSTSVVGADRSIAKMSSTPTHSAFRAWSSPIAEVTPE